jgi:1-deoxy-D-xylulose-5-phosphate synthase
MSYDILQNINGPADLKSLSMDDLTALAEEIRRLLIEKIHKHGGHYGPNLGFIEPTIALHYVFDSPKDKMVFDVSHQTYTNKILTGRKEKFLDDSQYDEYSGYSSPKESKHDFFTIGHTSTSISLATGLAKARDLKGEKYNVIAVIGDGSLSGGEAFEGLNNAAELGSNFIILVNDNNQSIAPNVGGMYKNFKELRETKGQASNNFFKAMGLDYRFIGDGNDLPHVIQELQSVKDIDHPIVLHMTTLKGKGDPNAVADKEKYHSIKPDSFNTTAYNEEEHYNDIATRHVVKRMKEDPSIVAIVPAVPLGTGWSKDRRREAGRQYIDVGIAEEQAIAMASGAAKGGAKPIVFDYSPFLQRTYDQLAQDLSLDKNPAVIISIPVMSGISSASSTHSSAFDMPMMNGIPNLTVLAPAAKTEFLEMLDWAIDQTDGPVALRLPGKVTYEYSGAPFTGDLHNQIVHKGSKIAILGLGAFLPLAQAARLEIKGRTGIDATIVNPRLASAADQDTLTELMRDHDLFITLEDGCLAGGFGEKVARFLGPTEKRVLALGQEKEVTDRVPLDELYKRYHLTPSLIADDAVKILNSMQ